MFRAISRPWRIAAAPLIPPALAACLLTACFSGGGDGGGDEGLGNNLPFVPKDCREAGAVGSATLSWEAVTLADDGATPLADLAGYKLYLGRAEYGLAHFIRLPADVTGYRIDGLRVGDCLFAVTAYDSAGDESAFSESWLLTVPEPELAEDE